jgi:hypothetical protein
LLPIPPERLFQRFHEHAEGEHQTHSNGDNKQRGGHNDPAVKEAALWLMVHAFGPL